MREKEKEKVKIKFLESVEEKNKKLCRIRKIFSYTSLVLIGSGKSLDHHK